MPKHDTVQLMTLGQFKDITTTLINAIPTKILTFEMARRIIGNKKFFIQRIKSVFDQLSGPYTTDSSRIDDFLITWLYKKESFKEGKGKIRGELSLEEVMSLLDHQAFGTTHLLKPPQFQRAVRELGWLSYEFPLAVLADNDCCYFFYDGDLIKKDYSLPDFVFPENCRFVSFIE